MLSTDGPRSPSRAISLPAGLHVLAERQASGRGGRRAFSVSVMSVSAECEYCGETFEGYPGNPNRFCSRECYSNWRSSEKLVSKTCLECGEKFSVAQCNADDYKHCSNECRYEAANEQRTCPECGSTFTVNQSEKKKFCSEECHHKAQRNRVELECATCGQTFEEIASRADRALYCSWECRKPSALATCRQCGGEFRVKPSRADDAQFCSLACRREYHDWRSTEKAECKYCGDEFTYLPASEKTDKFCSQECYWKSLRPEGIEEKPTTTCQHCGQQFEISPSEVGKRAYCSDRCRKGYVSFFGVYGPLQKCRQCGEIKASDSFPVLPNTRRGKSYKQRICLECKNKRAREKQYWMNQRRNRDDIAGKHERRDIFKQWHRQNGHCFWCGSRCGAQPSHYKAYHVDHLRPVEHGGTNWPRNLIIACPDCNMSKSDKLPIEFKRYRMKYLGAESTYHYGSTVPAGD